MKHKSVQTKFMFMICIFIPSWIDFCCANSPYCYIVQQITLLVVFPAIPLVDSQKKKKTTKDPKNTPTETYTTMMMHNFEDVDWTIHPAPYKERNDCYGHYIRCIRRTTPLIPVCGYSAGSGYFEDYYSICEIELENCLYRMASGKGVYGGIYWHNYIYHNGEGYNCVYYTRRANTAEELDLLYFGGDKTEVLRQWDRQNYELYHKSVYGPDEDDGFNFD